ncbi:proto-oncogene tyrosine-protein kinase Yrk-like [Haliotis asinina]|uniref:proto-oncogene tyrosine-protein kinase Yrk-like n=1 Tax=Haliotis asinina TaxID=109174 RepID=UPI003531E842
MGNKITRRKGKSKTKSNPSSECSSAHDLEAARRSLEPNIGDEIKDCTALFDFEGYHDCDLAFKKGDHFYHVRALRDRDDWLLATHSNNRDRGFVPRDYVSEDSVPSYYRTMGKLEREQLLLSEGVLDGTYIIKQASSWYVLEVRHTDTESGESRVKRYKIQKGRDKCLFISPQKTFTSVTQLLHYYTETEGSMCCRLRECLSPPKETVGARDLDIKPASLVVMDDIVRGTYGQVFQGTMKGTLSVAIKLVDMEMFTSAAPDNLMLEIKRVSLLLSQKSSRFVQILGVNMITTNMFQLVSELMVEGNLKDFLRRDQGQTIHFHQCVKIANEISDGMAFLQKHNETLRCGLRCTAVLVGQNLRVKINSFSLVKAPITKDNQALRWTAPECLKEDCEFTPKSDVWSFGVVMYEIITFGGHPFIEVAPKDLMARIASGYLMLKPVSRVPYDEDFWYGVMLKCWDMDPHKRPSFVSLNDMLGNYRCRLSRVPDYS